ncbi:hydrophobin-1 precursor [Pisolithus croceorrhizus]|nr:hydrophobin-1 precursor [Pisolithus croceorrhizus]
MKLAAVVVLAAAAAAVSAETNAQRMARGLPPKAPIRRHGTSTDSAKKGSPSSTGGGQCNTGPIQCCSTVGACGSHSDIDNLISLLGLSVPVGTQVGANCSPLSVVGTGGGAQCSGQTVCCEQNNWNGLINIGCLPLNLNA